MINQILTSFRRHSARLFAARIKPVWVYSCSSSKDDGDKENEAKVISLTQE
jgi:hypothetical protein